MVQLRENFLYLKRLYKKKRIKSKKMFAGLKYCIIKITKCAFFQSLQNEKTEKL